MKIVMALIGAVFSGAVMADPRIEVNANNSFCHVPHDANNDDNEAFIADCGGVVTPDNGVASGYATVVKENVPARAVPLDIVPGTNSAEIRLNGNNSDHTCVLVDSNGTEYTTNQWSTWVKISKYSLESPMGTATYEVFCFNAQQVN